MRANEFITEYKLHVSKDADGVAIKATAGGKNLGHAEFFFDEQGNLDPQTLWVDERFYGQGIARDMYDHLKGLGYTIVRSWDQTDAGKGFWDKHQGPDATVWESSAQTRLPKSIEQFLYSLTPSDVGVEKIGNYHVHFEGFTDDCKSSSDYCADPEAVYQEVFNDFVQREGGQRPIASGMVGDEDYPVLYSVFRVRSSKQVNEISDERLQDYLSRAGKRVDSRLERMARARQRLDKGYEIYHAEDPARVVHKFEANTPADAQRYYQDYIERYESDVDYDLRLRRSTGLTESTTFAQMPAQQIAKVAQDSFAQLYPGVKLYGASTVEGVGLSTQKGGAGSASAFAGGDTVRGEFYITLNAYAEGSEMIVVIEDATAGRYKGAATVIINSLFAAGERLYKTTQRALVINGNANTEAWSVIADRVGAEMVSENFADGKKPGRKGLAKRMGVNCKQSVTKLRNIAAHSSGERQRMAHWCANMKSGKKK